MPGTWRHIVDNTDPAQDIRAFREACGQVPDALTRWAYQRFADGCGGGRMIEWRESAWSSATRPQDGSGSLL